MFASVVELADGGILMPITATSRETGRGEALLIRSNDRGKTWEPELCAALRSDGAMRDLGYPWTIQLSDGSLFCAYYFNLHEAVKPYYDENASLALCEKWGLEPDLYTYRQAGLRFIAATIFSEDEVRHLAGTAVSESEVGGEGPTLL